jgi:hypothetical protein
LMVVLVAVLSVFAAAAAGSCSSSVCVLIAPGCGSLSMVPLCTATSWVACLCVMTLCILYMSSSTV